MTTKVNELAALQGIGPGRPPKHPPADAAQRIEELAADGWSIVGIAWKLGTTKRVFYKWIEQDESLRDAFEVGRERERQVLHNVLYRRAVEGEGRDSTLAALALLNSRHGYRTDSASDNETRVNVNISLRAPMSADEYRKALEHTIVAVGEAQ